MSVSCGAGGLGLAAIQIAKAAGALAVGTAGSAQKRANLRNLQVHAAVNSRSMDFATELSVDMTIKRPQTVLNSLTSPGQFNFVFKSVMLTDEPD